MGVDCHHQRLAHRPGRVARWAWQAGVRSGDIALPAGQAGNRMRDTASYLLQTTPRHRPARGSIHHTRPSQASSVYGKWIPCGQHLRRMMAREDISQPAMVALVALWRASTRLTEAEIRGLTACNICPPPYLAKRRATATPATPPGGSFRGRRWQIRKHTRSTTAPTIKNATQGSCGAPTQPPLRLARRRFCSLASSPSPRPAGEKRHCGQRRCRWASALHAVSPVSRHARRW